MDRFASNTLRTLAIVVISVVVIVGSLALLLLAFCFGLMGNLTVSGHHDPTVVKMFFGAILVAIVLVTVGVTSVARLARGIVREAPIPPPQLQTQSNAAAVGLASPPALTPPDIAPPVVQPPRIPGDAVFHLSPASRSAIHRLVLAIVAQVVAQLVPLLLAWRWILRSSLLNSRQTYLTALLSALVSNIPYLVLLFNLLRRPTRRTFAYALVIPSILILFGFFGSSATIFYLFRAGRSPASFLLTVPWILHVLILYLAWKAIRLTGILPNPARIIAAAVVIFFYYTLLPALLLSLAYVNR